MMKLSRQPLVGRDGEQMEVHKIVPFGLRLQPALKRKVEEAAKANGRSVNSEIALRLEASFSEGFDAASKLAAKQIMAMGTPLESVWVEIDKLRSRIVALEKK